MNPRITKREWGLLKGALRRVFSRSELRRSVVDAAAVEHADAGRPRVKKWARCNICGLPEAKSYVVVDHIEPVVAVDSTFEQQGLDVTVNRLWSNINNLQVVCEPCHTAKTKLERQARKKPKRKKK